MEKLLSLKAIEIKRCIHQTKDFVTFKYLNLNEIDRTAETAQEDTSNNAKKTRINN
jgi:hypothetical protein